MEQKYTYPVINITDTLNERQSQLPVIKIKGGGLSAEATAGETALLKAGVNIFQRGNKLVRPVIQHVKAAKARTTKVPSLVEVDKNYLRDSLCKFVVWKKYDGRNGGYKTVNPPKDVVDIIAHRQGEWGFRKIIGVISTQTMRQDGSILSKCGFDESTGLLLLDPPEMPSILDKPTRQDALDALALLNELLIEFPFTNDESRSVALSILITPIVRGAMTVSPMHAVNASTPGTGKSFLLDVSAAITLGQPCPVMAAGRNEEETEKRLGAAVIAGQSIISIDNVNGELGGDCLCQLVERPVVNIRILGKSEYMRVEARSVIFATGNNIRLVGDMNRRVIMATLDANQERPELRQFKNNPVETVLADRGKYIAAAITVVRAYLAVGSPTPAPRLASFEGWSDTVRSALIWLGAADPVKTMEAARAEDPFLQAISEVLAALKNTIGINESRTSAEIVKLALEKEGGGDNPYFKNHELRDALMSAAGDKNGYITPKALGKWFSRHEGRIISGIRLCKKNDAHGHPAKWWIESTAVEAVESG